MSRPTTARILGSDIPRRKFRPYGTTLDEPVGEILLTLDEAESLRLADLEGLYQQTAAQRMGVSRQTFGRIIESARRKTADALLNGKKLRIGGGVVELRGEDSGPLVVAIPTNSKGEVEAHFGRCERLSIFRIGEDGSIQSEEIVETAIGPGCKSHALSSLAAMGARALVVGCIGDGAVRVCGGHGIAIVRGASGPARSVALAYSRGELADSGLACGAACKALGRGCV